MFGLPMGFVPAPAVSDAPVRVSSDEQHYCPTPDCDTSWWGLDSCWACGAEGISRVALPEPDKKTWGSGFTNGFSPNYQLTEGDPL